MSQLFIDVEPLVRIIRGDQILHGFTHTLAGALLVGAAAALVARPAANPLLGLVGLGPLHLFCIVSGAAGVALLIVYAALVARRVGSQRDAE